MITRRGLFGAAVGMAAMPFVQTERVGTGDAQRYVTMAVMRYCEAFTSDPAWNLAALHQAAGALGAANHIDPSIAVMFEGQEHSLEGFCGVLLEAERFWAKKQRLA